MGFLTASISARYLESARLGAERFSVTAEYAVATTHLATGKEVGVSEVALVELPSAMVPENALREPPTGARLRHDVSANEVLTTAAVTTSATSELSARVGPDQRALALPRGDTTVPVRIGDIVDVLSITAEAGQTEVIASAATVIDLSETQVTIAVPRTHQHAVADAIAMGLVQLGLLPPDT